MHHHRQRTAFLAGGIAAALALSGAAVAAAMGHAATTAKITVTEREYHIALSASSVKAGSVVFEVHNAGKIAHKLDIAGAGLKSTVKLATISPGATRSVTVKVTGGKLSLWCPLPGHAALGMKTSMKVAGGKASGSAWG